MANIFSKLFGKNKERPSEIDTYSEEYQKEAITKDILSQIPHDHVTMGLLDITNGINLFEAEVSNNYGNILDILIQNPQIVHERDRFKDKTLLHYAVLLEALKVTENLLQMGADVNSKDEDGLTPLTIACGGVNSRLIAAKLLISKGADVNYKTQITIPNSPKQGWTPIHMAARNGHPKIVDLLILNGADINATKADGWTPLHVAVAFCHIEIVRLLLSKSANLNARANDGFTVLMACAYMRGHIDEVNRGYAEIAKLLLEKGVDIIEKDRNGQTVLMHAIEIENTHLLKVLEDWNELVKCTKPIQHTKTVKESLNVVQIRNETNKAIPLQEDIDRFVATAEEGDIATVRDMIEKGMNPNALDEHGWPAITGASQRGHKSVVEILLSNDADPNVPSVTGETALMRAAWKGHIEIVDLLLKSAADINATDNDGITALIHAAYAGKKDMVQLLISNGADVRARDDRGKTAWESAAQQGHMDILDLLDRAGAKSEKGQGEVFVLAAARGDIETVNRFLNSGIDANIKIYNGLTALMSSSQNGHGQIVNLLLSHGATVDLWDEHDSTPLMKSAEKGHADIVEHLIQSGADVLAKDIAGFSAVLLAVYEGHREIVRLLLESGANPNSFEPLSLKTVLAIAREKGHQDVVDILRKWGARDELEEPASGEIKITDIGD